MCLAELKKTIEDETEVISNNLSRETLMALSGATYPATTINVQVKYGSGDLRITSRLFLLVRGEALEVEDAPLKSK